MRGLFVAVGTVVLVAWSARAEAQCVQNADCRGGRICVNGTCVAPQCTRDVDCPTQEICENGVCITAGAPTSPPSIYAPPVAPVPLPTPVVSPESPASSLIVQINGGFGPMFSGVGGGAEVGYAGQYLGGGLFFNLGYFVSLATGTYSDPTAAGEQVTNGTGAFGYGGGGRFLAGYNPHFGYIAFAYSLVKTATIKAGYQTLSTSEVWGPSLLFGYQYTAERLRLFADVGFSWVGDAVSDYPPDSMTGAVFTFNVGVGCDLIV